MYIFEKTRGPTATRTPALEIMASKKQDHHYQNPQARKRTFTKTMSKSPLVRVTNKNKAALTKATEIVLLTEDISQVKR